jgi:penicillin-binding protein 1C
MNKVKAKKIIFRSALTVFILWIFFLLLNLIFPLREPPGWSVVVNDKDGNILHAFLSVDDKWRMHAGLEEIGPVMVETIIYKEDNYFYYHYGINPVSMVRAAFNNTIAGRKTSGASTITMQVARLLYPAKRTYLNKFIEMFRAIQLEWKYSKKEILELYLNLIPYGGNVEGVKAASVLYFGIQPSKLNLSQSVSLAIIPNRPNSLSPKKGSKLLQKERDKWLKRMLQDKFQPEAEIQNAMEEHLVIEKHYVPRLVPHLANKLKNNHANTPTITSSIDKNIQQKCEAIAYNQHQKLRLKNIHNLSVLVIENTSRKVRAYVGSPDYSDQEHAGQVDGCTAVRSPGSTLKPLVYGLAIDKGIITTATMLPDVPVNYSGYSPENFDDKCNGLVSAGQALAYSLNIPAVSLLSQVGVPHFTDKLRRNGFEAIKSDQEMGLSVVLGGCGVRVTEMGALFAAFANNGVYAPLSYLENKDSIRKSILISDAAAFLVTEMLTKLVRPDLPNNFESSLHVPKIAWKTGTSYGRRDAWSIGYNRKYTIVVWCGNFNGEGVPELTGGDIATPVLFDLFNAIDYNSSSEWYLPPASVDFRLVCSQSGLPPAETCTDIITDYFLPQISNSKKCAHLREVFVSADERFSYCTRCLPESGYKTKMCKNLPSAVTAFYQLNNITFEQVPPHNPECTRLFSDNAPVITSPVNGKEYLLEKNAGQQLQLQCQVEADIHWIYWYINDKFHKRTKPNEVTFFIPEEGTLKISCSDDKGRNEDIEIVVNFY